MLSYRIHGSHHPLIEVQSVHTHDPGFPPQIHVGVVVSSGVTDSETPGVRVIPWVRWRLVGVAGLAFLMIVPVRVAISPIVIVSIVTHSRV